MLGVLKEVVDIASFITIKVKYIKNLVIRIHNGSSNNSGIFDFSIPFPQQSLTNPTQNGH